MDNKELYSMKQQIYQRRFEMWKKKHKKILERNDDMSDDFNTYEWVNEPLEEGKDIFGEPVIEQEDHKPLPNKNNNNGGNELAKFEIEFSVSYNFQTTKVKLTNIQTKQDYDKLKNWADNQQLIEYNRLVDTFPKEDTKPQYNNNKKQYNNNKKQYNNNNNYYYPNTII